MDSHDGLEVATRAASNGAALYYDHPVERATARLLVMMMHESPKYRVHFTHATRNCSSAHPVP